MPQMYRIKIRASVANNISNTIKARNRLKKKPIRLPAPAWKCTINPVPDLLR